MPKLALQLVQQIGDTRRCNYPSIVGFRIIMSPSDNRDKVRFDPSGKWESGRKEFALQVRQVGGGSWNEECHHREARDDRVILVEESWRDIRRN